MLGQPCAESVVLNPSRMVPMCILYTKTICFTRSDKPVWTHFGYQFGTILERFGTFCLQGLPWRLQIGALKTSYEKVRKNELRGISGELSNGGQVPFITRKQHPQGSQTAASDRRLDDRGWRQLQGTAESMDWLVNGARCK